MERSNIIRFDDMGYPLLLCINNEGEQVWIDVSEEWAKQGLENGTLHVLRWFKIS